MNVKRKRKAKKRENITKGSHMKQIPSSNFFFGKKQKNKKKKRKKKKKKRKIKSLFQCPQVKYVCI